MLSLQITVNENRLELIMDDDFANTHTAHIENFHTLRCWLINYTFGGYII